MPALYAELRRMARAELGRMAPGQSVGPTELVHEAFVRLIDEREEGWESQRHFHFAAARAMRDVLVERQRRKSALKRGGDRERAELDPDALAAESESSQVVALAEVLERMERDEPERREIVRLRFYCGMSEKQTASKLGMPLRTLERHWAAIRECLRRELSRARGSD